MTISSAAHIPVMPQSGDSVAVTAYVVSDNPIASTEPFVDAGSGFGAVRMFDDGNHHDGSASDGHYGAVLPPNLSATAVL